MPPLERVNDVGRCSQLCGIAITSSLLLRTIKPNRGLLTLQRNYFSGLSATRHDARAPHPGLFTSRERRGPGQRRGIGARVSGVRVTTSGARRQQPAASCCAGGAK